MDRLLVSGSIEYAVVDVRQRERVEHTDSGTLASVNIFTVVATYASARLQPGYTTFATAAATVQYTAGASQCNKHTDDIGNHGTEDPDHYDTNLVFKATLKRTIEPTAWSRAKGLAGMDVRDVTVAHLCRHGMEEFGLRGLSHGKFTGMILTRNIAESVLLSQLQKKLRESNIDVDATIDAIHQSKGQKAPDKVKEAITFVAPLVDTIMDAIKPWAQVRNYGAKNTEGDNQAAQRMQALEEQTAKYKQRLRSAGIDVTPQKSLPLQNEPNEGPEATAAPPKRRRLTKGAIKQRNEDILAEPHNVIRASGQEPPTSMTSIATWITNLKKSLPREKHAEVDNHIQSVQTILEGAKYTKAELQEMATRWGLPMSLTTAPKASPKNLQQLIAAVTYLAQLKERMRQSPAAEQLKERLREKGAVPELYTFEKFSQPCAVYVKLVFPRLNKQTYATATRDASFCYIGSTNITVAKREYNRVAKLRQLQQLKLPKTEIAIRYWNDSQTYQHYSTILLSQHSEYIDAWAEEHSLIQRWQPKLNYPYVTKELVKKAHGLQAQFWKLLYAISSDTKQEFEASKELRSGKHDSETVTLLYRLANHMEQPWRSKARARLRKVLQFKNASIPKHNKPLKVPLLAHASHRTNLEKYLVRLSRTHRHVLIPYHLPTKTVQEATHPSLERALWNHKRKVTDMGRHWKPTECQCAQFIKQHPRAQVHEGHVVTGLETLQLHSTNQIFQNIGAGNAFYSSKKRIKKQHQEQFQRWLKHHQFPRDQRILDDFDDFFEQEWKQHRLQLQREPRLTHRLAKNILGMIPDDYIVHNEDHANAHLMIYCPNIYNQAAYNTWMDKQTFRMLDADPAEIKQAMQNNTPKIVAKHYTKLLAYEKPLPYGYILMRRKKRWAKGRTIIAYSNTCIGKLLKIAALALQQMLRITWPNHFGDVSSPQLWEEIHQLFYNNEHLYPERHLKFLNHDLVGFFNSIPQSDILQSIQFLTSQFLDEHNATITVDPHNKIAPAHSGRSTYSLKSNMVKVQAEHIPAIIQFSFDACAFTAIGEVFQQTCGTSMGNQISPILSTCAIVATEITWLRMYGQFVSSAHLHDKFWIRRYVDNRAIIVDEDELQHNPFIQQLASLQFYKKPVQLEDEACDDFLGFRIHADNRKITYNLHREPWRYRLPQSAGTTKLRLSGYHSRKHLIRTSAYPEDVAQRQLQELDDLYGDLGYARLLKIQQSQRLAGISRCNVLAPLLRFFQPFQRCNTFLQFFGSSLTLVGFRVKMTKKQRINGAASAAELTDIDTDSEAAEYVVRLPHGLPLDMSAPESSTAKDDPVEQECQLLLQQRYIPFELFPRLSAQLNSEFLRASALTKAGRRTTSYTVGAYYHAGSTGVRTNTRQRPWTAALMAYLVRACTHTTFSTVSLLRNVHMRTHRDKYNKPGSLNIVIPVSTFRQGHLWVEEDDGPDLSPNGQHHGRNLEVKLPGIEFSPFKLHGTCPWKSDRLIISAYTTNRIEDICREDKRYLRMLGFNLT
ncbi:unnamed protein product [Symbiodinium sp. CCMP2592]|nr:unnamed protein product [Symbiodinium sp. CCMP2592]